MEDGRREGRQLRRGQGGGRLGGPGVQGSPEGYVKVDPNHHLWSRTRIGQIRKDGQFDVIFETPELIKPDPFPKGYQ